MILVSPRYSRCPHVCRLISAEIPPTYLLLDIVQISLLSPGCGFLHRQQPRVPVYPLDVPPLLRLVCDGLAHLVSLTFEREGWFAGVRFVVATGGAFGISCLFCVCLIPDLSFFTFLFFVSVQYDDFYRCPCPVDLLAALFFLSSLSPCFIPLSIFLPAALRPLSTHTLGAVVTYSAVFRASSFARQMKQWQHRFTV